MNWNYRCMGYLLPTMAFVGVLFGCGDHLINDLMRPVAGQVYAPDAVRGEALATGASDNSPLPIVPNLIFQSGFEQGTQHVQTTSADGPCTDDLWGEDESVGIKGDWINDLEDGLLGKGHFCFGGGTFRQRGVRLTKDPENHGNQVLHTWIAAPNENISDDNKVCNRDKKGSRKARVQHVLKDNPTLSEFQYRVRLRLGKPAFEAMVNSPYKITWMTIGEFWNNSPEQEHPFRVTLNLVKAEERRGASFYFGLKGEKQNEATLEWEQVWREQIVSDVAVPLGEWFTFEVGLREGNRQSGRARVHVTKADGLRYKVADVRDWTYHPEGTPDGFQSINTMKLYTSGQVMCGLRQRGHVLQAWWDDYAIGGSP